MGPEKTLVVTVPSSLLPRNQESDRGSEQKLRAGFPIHTPTPHLNECPFHFSMPTSTSCWHVTPLKSIHVYHPGRRGEPTPFAVPQQI